jgi:hypothetical protein
MLYCRQLSVSSVVSTVRMRKYRMWLHLLVIRTLALFICVARKLNANAIVLLQHLYGIFGLGMFSFGNPGTAGTVDSAAREARDEDDCGHEAPETVRQSLGAGRR